MTDLNPPIRSELIEQVADSIARRAFDRLAERMASCEVPHDFACGRCEFGRAAWVLRDAQPLRVALECSGNQRLCDLPAESLARIGVELEPRPVRETVGV